jgi:methionine--tRNA ligase beta chain
MSFTIIGDCVVSFDEFKKLELKIGEIISVEHVPNADKLYVLQVDLGGKQAQLVAGLRPYYKDEELKGKKIVVVTNLDPVTIRGVSSEGMLLAAQEGDAVSLLTVDRPVSPGSGVR